MKEAAKINIDDAVLVQQCRFGDQGAVEQLILKYQNRIYNVVLKICANHDDAAELTQETFVKIIENVDRFEAKSSFYTWAFRIAVNLAINYCKRKTKSAARSLDSDDSDNYPDAGAALKEFLHDQRACEPAEIAANAELCEMAIKALMKLDEPQRTAVVLKDIEGMNYSQIAKVLNVELGTVKSRLSRARANLRKILETAIQ